MALSADDPGSMVNSPPPPMLSLGGGENGLEGLDEITVFDGWLGCQSQFFD